MGFNFLEKPFMLFDGAMGTMLQRNGLKPGEKPETYNIIYPEIVEGIHRQYIDAGSDIITTNTFGANEIRLSGSEYSVEQVVKAAVEIAKKASNGRLVALDLGPTGEFIEPFGDLTREKAYEIFARQVSSGEGADLILIETISDITEAECAIEAAKKNSSLPVVCTLTFQKEGRTFMGQDVKTVTKALENMGVDALGVNCSVGPEDIMPIVKEMLELTNLPIAVQPNAGLPEVKGGEIVYNITPEKFASYAKQMKDMGVKLFGGCCGTDPSFIKAVKSASV